MANEINRTGLTLAFQGHKDDNWDIFVDTTQSLWAIARPNSGCKDSWFGKKEHVKNLIANYRFADDHTCTDAGLELMNGLNSRLFCDSKGKKFSVLGFN